MNDKKYIQKDIDRFADLDGLDEYLENNIGSNRKDAIEYVLPDSADVTMERDGGYQGCCILYVELDGYYWLTNDRYGSCGFCDFFISDPVEWTEQQVREFYCFGTLSDMKDYLQKERSFDGLYEEELTEIALDIVDEKISNESDYELCPECGSEVENLIDYVRGNKTSSGVECTNCSGSWMWSEWFEAVSNQGDSQ